jgi:hypothetical protein
MEIKVLTLNQILDIFELTIIRTEISITIGHVKLGLVDSCMLEYP